MPGGFLPDGMRRLTMMMQVRFPLSPKNLAALGHKRGIDVSRDTLRFWWHRLRQIFTTRIARRRDDEATSGFV